VFAHRCTLHGQPATTTSNPPNGDESYDPRSTSPRQEECFSSPPAR
jgi:hypothetical protein